MWIAKEWNAKGLMHLRERSWSDGANTSVRPDPSYLDTQKS